MPIEGENTTRVASKAVDAETASRTTGYAGGKAPYKKLSDAGENPKLDADHHSAKTFAEHSNKKPIQATPTHSDGTPVHGDMAK